jgi:hypothetical protein
MPQSETFTLSELNSRQYYASVLFGLNSALLLFLASSAFTSRRLLHSAPVACDNQCAQ